MKCHHCQETGHKAADMTYPARALDGLQVNLEIICGGKNTLSNLHNCEDGCLIQDGQHDFSSSEQHYQFNHLRFHSKIVDSYQILEVDSSFQ